MATKICDVCDKEIGESEKTCPACGANLEEIEETVAAIERAQGVIDKRKKRLAPAPEPNPTPAPAKATGLARLREIGRAVRKEK